MDRRSLLDAFYIAIDKEDEAGKFYRDLAAQADDPEMKTLLNRFAYEERIHGDKLKGWFVMVKDSKGTHPGNPLWGDGWGWSWFDADKPLKTTSTDYHSDCQGCHVPATATDWIYVNGYPVLRR